MNCNSQSEVGMLTLTLCDSTDADQLALSAERISHLPGVLRVRTDIQFNKLEIVFKNPAEGLLRAVHSALQSARCATPAAQAD